MLGVRRAVRGKGKVSFFELASYNGGVKYSQVLTAVSKPSRFTTCEGVTGTRLIGNWLDSTTRTEILEKYDNVSVILLYCEQMIYCVRKYNLPTIASLLCVA